MSRCAAAGESFDETPGDRGREERVAGADQPDGGEQVFRANVLEEEPAGSGGQRRVPYPFEVEGGQHDHAWLVGGGR